MSTDEFFTDFAPVPVEQAVETPLDEDGEALIVEDPQLHKCDILADFPWARDLTYKQALFVMAYCGDTAAACREVGIPACTGARWLKIPSMRYALRERLLHGIAPELVADKDERLAFWSRILRDDSMSVSERLKASELLGKSEAQFSERRILEGTADKPVNIIIETGVPQPHPVDITHEVIDDE